ncbi:MAG: hypothetical protein AAF517_08650 [Planctomycetota bacterium]
MAGIYVLCLVLFTVGVLIIGHTIEKQMRKMNEHLEEIARKLADSAGSGGG